VNATTTLAAFTTESYAEVRFCCVQLFPARSILSVESIQNVESKMKNVESKIKITL